MNADQQKLQAAIENLENLVEQGILSPEQAEISLAPLRAQLATYTATVTGGGAAAQGPGAKAVGQGGTLVEGNFTQNNYYRGEDPAEDAKRLTIYRQWVLRATGNLPLRGVDVGASNPEGEQKTLGLTRVYVNLDTTQRVKLSAAEKQRLEKERGLRGEDSRPLAALEALSGNRHLVLLGDPGSGKTTFVNFVAHCLAAHPLEPNAGWLNALTGWQVESENLLPIPITLRDFARHFAEDLSTAEPERLLEFIAARLKAQNLSFALPLLERALDAGSALVLLDGLDEVPTQAQRVFVRDSVRKFIERHSKSRFLVTCRILSYTAPARKNEPDLRLTELPDFTLAAFDDEKIKRFVQAWYAELANMGSVPPQDAPELAERLQTAVRRPDLEKLASNPLLLTVMALVHSHRGRLPDARALLYEETIDILLWRWEEIKLTGKQDAPRLRQALLEAGRADVDLKNLLWKLAFEAHAATRPDANGESLADIPEYRLVKGFAALKCSQQHPEGDLTWAQTLVTTMKLRAGLLLERQPEVFTFPHRTFQEYLAGAHLAAQANFVEQASQLVRANYALWREAVLYAVGKLVYVNGETAKPLALAAELCPESPEDTETGWRMAWLAGEVLNEIGTRRVRDSGFGRDLLKRIASRNCTLLKGAHLPPKERAKAGKVLAELGDPRAGVQDVNGLRLSCIPGGKFVMGSVEGEGDSDERPQHEVEVGTYWMSEYPITQAQYGQFMDAGGYSTERYWAEARKLGYWQAGKFKGEWDTTGRTAPVRYGGAFDLGNHPVVGVTWFESLAFTRWLTEQWRADGLLPEGWCVRLPSEAEWEKAARGGLYLSGESSVRSIREWDFAQPVTIALAQANPQPRRTYPWGNEPNPNFANYGETGIGTTSTVGAFPGGASPYGVQDLSGNVWEWTRTIWDTKKYPYPYTERDGRERVEDEKLARVVRGGSFDLEIRLVRCAVRRWNYFDYRFRDVGFRVVVSPCR